ncbi:unnamed protein product [Lymnaea stagnalis]|uniref:C2H2-type domain-containing protein n=1 Tax=Lymnaea stagnalis TaxID=6523 RepID=A0AAV2HA78_LYMST
MISCFFISDKISRHEGHCSPTGIRSQLYQSDRFSQDHCSTSQSITGFYQCIHCPAKLTSAAFLKAHIEETHQNIMPFSCSLCGKGYLSSTGLYLHMLLHEGKSFQCPLCHWKFTQKCNLKRHLGRVHHRNQCLTCAQIFPFGQEYDQHVLQCGK